jgi:Zn-dependent protease/predicted transcriptional regulator
MQQRRDKMFGRRIELFKLLGFSVKVDLSWVFIAVLVTWSLAGGFFPERFPPEEYSGLSTSSYWWMGLAGMLGLFASIVLHELGHSLVARSYGVHMKGITLFIFGGVAEMNEEPPSAKAEFMVAVAGPIVSVLIAAGCYGLYRVGGDLGLPATVSAVLWYLGWVNGLLVAFNLVPAFPLDGGRVLRSLLWHVKGKLKWATRITAEIGSGFGLVLIIMGVFSLLGGGFVAGMWWALLGLFLRAAAQSSYQQLLMRRALEGEPIARFMTSDVKSVPPEATLRQLVDDYVYAHHHKMFPVTENGRLVGCVTTRRIRDVPSAEWEHHVVQEVADVCGDENTVAPDADAMQALSRMKQHDVSRLMVVEEGQLRGVVSIKDMLKFMSLKVELEEE